MKKLVLAAALSAVASTAFAGGLDAPVMEPEVMVEEQSSSSAGGIIVPLLVLAVIVAAGS